MNSEIQSEIQIGTKINSIFDGEVIHQEYQNSLDKILENISILKMKTDIYIQRIIDNNKHLISDHKGKKVKDDDEMGIQEDDL